MRIVQSTKSMKIQKERIIKEGCKYFSTPYHLGAKPFQTREFDCSSFVQYLYARSRILLPRTSRLQSLLGKKVKKEHLKRGDLLFFTNRCRCKKKGLNKVAHIAIYLGNNKMLHSCKYKGVTVSKLSEIINQSTRKRWNDYFLFAKRYPNVEHIVCGRKKWG